MGTTLTGTTPQDTYDSLIKVTDNGPLSGTAKYLSDGLGNDSVLALSTARVGIGTTSGTSRANILSATVAQTVLTLEGNYASSGSVELLEFNRNGGAVSGAIKYQDADTAMSIGTTTSHGFLFNTGDTERMRITSAGEVLINRSSASGLGKLNVVGGADFTGGNVLMCRDTGNVGIGTSSPAEALEISRTSDPKIRFVDVGNTDAKIGIVGSSALGFELNGSEIIRLTSNGLTFNGDTAAANALDDYEEGTWTMGVSFGNASVGVTTSSNAGSYTKIGRQVTATGYLVLTSKGSSTGFARITGLPFTIAGATSNYSAPTLYLENTSFANAFQGFGVNGTTLIALYETTEAGSVTVIDDTNFSNSSAIIISFTYFV